MKYKIKKTIPVVLILIGLALISLPVSNNFNLKKNMNRVTIDDASPKQLQENDATVLPKEYYDFSKVKEIMPTSTFIGSNSVDASLLVGQIVIPSINLNLSIFKGTTDYNLLAGVTTMKESDKMGKGNYTLAGHYNKDKSILFGGLMDVKVGDIIKITDKSNIYEYRVYCAKTVDDSAVDMISDEKAAERGNSIISLMTCYFSSKTGKRYFVLGDLVDTYPYKKEKMFLKKRTV